jgi:murein L,D-transpeptidase YcbB/YkuD
MQKLSASRTWINVMEAMVAEEVDRQLQKLSEKKLSFLKADEIITYALNRVSPLYANSSRGLLLQQQRAKQHLQKEVESAVRQGLAAVERDPLRQAEPIQSEGDPKAEQSLRQMRRLLQRPDVTWENLPAAMEQALNEALAGQKTWAARANPGQSSGRYDIRTGRIRAGLGS